MSILSDVERERIREFESLKKEIRQELDMEPKEGLLLGVLKHPLLLLVVGFLLTSYLGGRLTDSWNAETWKNQQAYLEKQRTMEKRFDLIERTVKGVAETNSAAEDVLARYVWSGWTHEEIHGVRKRWIETSREWRVSSKTLDEDLGFYFPETQVRSKFQEIMKLRVQSGNAITNLLSEPKPSKKEIDDANTKVLELNRQMKDLLQICGELMTKETKMN